MNDSTVRRGGLTLMEIMFAIVILSIGLLGVLAAIPFGALQMGRMVEKDFVNNLGQSALSTIHANGWDNPYRWGIYTRVDGSETIVETLLEDTNDFRHPCMLDPLGFLDFDEERYTYLWSPGTHVKDVSKGDSIRFVFPKEVIVDGDVNVNLLDSRFRSMDDIIYKKESGSMDRPTMLTDTETGEAQFKGEYSWMAMMTPIAADPSNRAESMTFPPDSDSNTEGDPGAAVDMRADVVVFRGRAVTDQFESCLDMRDTGTNTSFTVKDEYMMAAATLEGSNYAGGTFRLKPKPYLNYSGSTKPTAARQREYLSNMLKALKSSTHVLLIGPADNFDAGAFDASNSSYVYPRLYARWAKIASYSRIQYDSSNTEPADQIRVTVIGEDCPASWMEGGGGAGRVRMIVYPNVRGVFTRTFRIGGVD